MNGNINKQKGVTLIIALIIMTVLTLLGVSSIKTSTVNLKIASNDRSKFNTFQAANSAIDEALINLNTSNPIQQTATYTYKVGVDNAGSDILVTANVTLTAGSQVTGVPNENPMCIFMQRNLISTATYGSSKSVQVQGILKKLPLPC